MYTHSSLAKQSFINIFIMGISIISEAPLSKLTVGLYSEWNACREHWMDNLGPDIYNKEKLKDFWGENKTYIATDSWMVVLIP